MNINEVAKQLNELSVKHNFKIADLQKIRFEKYGSVHTYKIFSAKSATPKHDYAFHSGGRKELQFNIGEETRGGKKIFRYGVAYSLERNRSEHRLMEDLEPSKQRFNLFFSETPEFFKDYNLWYYINNKRTDYSQVTEISDEIYKDNSFIFIGKYFNKSINDLTEEDFHNILKEFDRLFPLYKFCLDENISPRKKDKRIMRLTWNTNNWEYPSGHVWRERNQGKSEIAHENQYGYGHEEWLFNKRYRINNFQYGYIRGISNLSEDKEIIDEIVLYTIRDDKERCIVGVLKNVEIIEGYDEEQKKIKGKLEKHLSDEIKELKKVNADYEYFRRYDRLHVNVKFKWEDAIFLQDPLPVTFLEGAKFNRFQAYKLNEELEELVKNEVKENLEFKFQAGKASSSKSYKKTTEKKNTNVKRKHGDITDSLYDFFISSGFNESQLSAERTYVGGNIVDFVVNESENFSLFEVKTSHIAIKNIRQALGQLFEYAFLDKKIKIAKLVIIGPAVLKDYERNYFYRICGLINIPMEYWTYIESNPLQSKFIKQ